MRAIKFRAWDKANKHMVIGSHENKFNLTFDGDFMFFETMSGSYLNPKTQFELMQFTGLKDKNGKEIYEGDIVRSGKSNIDVVAYFSDGFKLSNIGHLDRWHTELSEISNPVRNCEIIGNIYENKEILED